MGENLAQAASNGWILVLTYVPNLLGAVVLLVAGWFVASFAANGVERLLEKTKLGIKVADAVADEDSEEPRQLERWFSRGVFYLLMLFVLVGFFQILGVTQISEPIIKFLNEIFEYAPRLIGPAFLIVIAWVLAKFLRVVVRKAAQSSKLGSRLRQEADLGASKKKKEPLADTLADAVYWLTMLLFLPAVLSALDLGGLLEPVRDVVKEILGYLPNLMGAGLVLAVGWFVARILRRVVTNLLAASGLDSLAGRAGMDKIVGDQKLSSLAGLIVYILVFIPVIVAALNALEIDAVTQPVSAMLSSMLSALPNIFAGVLILVVAYVVGRIIAGLATNVLSGIGFDALLSKIGLGGAEKIGTKSLSEIAGYILLTAIMMFAAIEALQLIGFASFATLVSALLVFASQILFGVVVIALGVFLGKVAGDLVRSANPPQAETLATIAHIAVVVMAVVMGMEQMGVGDEVITLAFGVTLGAIGVAGAIAFGFGGREVAGEMIKEWRDSVTAKRKKPRSR